MKTYNVTWYNMAHRSLNGVFVAIMIGENEKQALINYNNTLLAGERINGFYLKFQEIEEVTK